MSQLFSQLSFVSAILAGFAFTFIAGLLTSSSLSRSYNWVFVSALLAGLSLMVAAVGSVFGGLDVEAEFLSALQIQQLLALVPQAFLVGVFPLVFSAGCSGWLRSRQLGLFSSAIACLAAFVLASVVLPFFRLQ